jgi:hypothetical protein
MSAAGKLHRVRPTIRALIVTGILACTVALSACHRAAVVAAPVAEQLTCGDSTMPRATYARATKATRSDSLSDVAIVVQDSTHRGLKAAEVQAWEPTGAISESGQASGTTVFTGRDPGLYSLRVRMQAAGPRWMYAATLRPAYADTVIVTVGTRCTLVWRGR